jgi:hypothetical protein
LSIWYLYYFRMSSALPPRLWNMLQECVLDDLEERKNV